MDLLIFLCQTNFQLFKLFREWPVWRKSKPTCEFLLLQRSPLSEVLEHYGWKWQLNIRFNGFLETPVMSELRRLLSCVVTVVYLTKMAVTQQLPFSDLTISVVQICGE
ncbi:hypothetical protein AMECASPLE_023854 [Ameca splendens]|uniref:Uncharacterized protein n=1 Tax=Ameca splendens TaxID=208324 RepID=A0ABV0XH87_9TELE